MNTKLPKLFFMLVLFSLMATGCYWNDDIATNQVGVQLDRNEIVRVVGPGVYSEVLCTFCELKAMDIDTLTFPVEDPEVLTKDNQAVSVKVTVQARRKSDNDSVENIFTRWSTLVNNDALITTISATAREGMKNGTRNFTLPELLNDRNGLAEAIREQLELDAEKYSVEIINVTIENIGPSESYMAILSETANLNAQTDQEKRRQDLINQKAQNSVLEQQQRVKVAESQVLAERAETEVQVEIARRQGEVIAAANEVYSLNPQAYELERLRLLKFVLGEKNVIYLPSDVVLTLLNNMGNNTVVPVPSVNPEGGQ